MFEFDALFALVAYVLESAAMVGTGLLILAIASVGIQLTGKKIQLRSRVTPVPTMGSMAASGTR